VRETRPGAGTELRHGSPVTVVVAGTTKVPPVTGRTSEQACQAITAARLVCKAVPQGVADTPEKLNIVHGQSPAAETALPTGREVTVYFYAQNQILVPNVVGMDPATARATLGRYGLAQGTDNPHEVTPQANVVHVQDVAAGTPVNVGTPVGITYQAAAPIGLHRFKLENQSARFLTYDNGPMPSRGRWNDLGVIASVYAPGERGVPGVVDIEEWRCDQNCGKQGRDPAYTYRSSDAQDPPDSRGGPWHLNTARPDGRPYAFSCFSRQQPQPAGTRVLKGLYRPSDESWAFAVEGSGEYNQHLHDGFGGQPSREFKICYVW
jgi:PASTA domain